jgi:hypothetical protein
MMVKSAKHGTGVNHSRELDRTGRARTCYVTWLVGTGEIDKAKAAFEAKAVTTRTRE